MMKIYICPQCGWVRPVSRRSDVECHKCKNMRMRLTNLDFVKYTSMTEQERRDYAAAWLYIHARQKGI
ncbi:MAG: DNA-directed RNA polymerase subunit M [Clostridiales bacterium]|nr:DNA-directed RNA polymerase subunit M [Clostridiales bacterium]